MDIKTAWQPDFSREDVETVKRLGDYYRRHLTEEVMPFWESRTRDERGGYITCFNRAGEVTDTDKYIWFQGRNLWMFSALYNHVERRELWLDLARWGRDFLVKHAYAGGGRWYYRLDRAGGVKEGTISIHTDHYLLEGLCEYATASGSGEDGRLIEETYAALERNVRDMECRDLYHAVWDPVLKPHSVPLMAMGTIGVAAQTLGYDRIRPLQDYCIEQILWVFAKDEYEVLFESVARDGGVRFEGEGLVFSPGHAMESAWFVMREGLRHGDGAIVNRALKITDWAYQKGFDKEYGGVYGAVSALGGEPPQTDWFLVNNSAWDNKVWWVNVEALYCLALACTVTRSKVWLKRFLELHEFCKNHFYDPEYGEWYAELKRDGSPCDTDKGTVWKAAYHLPRALMQTMQLFESFTI